MKSKSAIWEMFYGEKQHHEMTLTDEYKRILDEVVKNDDELRAKLTNAPELLDLYERTNNSIESLHCESVENHYVNGFKLGLLIGMEVATDSDI